ncbi:MAG TPA: hypothetical protein VJ553_05060, partial [Candidatus Paceibacterota bacterium]|nr:hypothetical protein [Candidatus Paceibacterota bacterium]
LIVLTAAYAPGATRRLRSLKRLRRHAFHGRPMMDHLRGKWSIDVPRAALAGVLIVLAALLLFSCEQPSYTNIEWLPDGDGFVQYCTNDPRKYNTIQYDPRPEEYELTMTTVTATVKKVTGAGNVGFGIVFCYTDDNNNYLLLISTEGKYTVAENVGGTYTALIPWTDSLWLYKGLGETNDIGITQNPVGTFKVTINGNEIISFPDSSFTGGQAGPCIGIGSFSDEEFPYIPEDGRFMMLAPVPYP